MREPRWQNGKNKSESKEEKNNNSNSLFLTILFSLSLSRRLIHAFVRERTEDGFFRVHQCLVFILDVQTSSTYISSCID